MGRILVFRRPFQCGAVLHAHSLPDFQTGILADQRKPFRVFLAVQLQHVGLHFLHDPDQVGAVGQVAVMQVETLVIDVRILVDILDPTGVEARAAALHAVDFVALLTWLLNQIVQVALSRRQVPFVDPTSFGASSSDAGAAASRRGGASSRWARTIFSSSFFMLLHRPFRCVVGGLNLRAQQRFCRGQRRGHHGCCHSHGEAQ